MSSPTSTATTTPSAASAEAKVVLPAETTELTFTSDVYGMFVGAFFIVLSLIVLISTGSILSVLVLWATVALILTVLVYYGILSIDALLGQAKKVEKEVEKEVPVEPSRGAPLVGSEVFHISDAQFTYDEAPAVCAAYGSQLATLEQIMDAYAKGAEWCGYGWSAGGMALYPTQRETWEQLQNEVDPGKRTRCGRPGVNGGYFDPNLKFGVNCFGFKPAGRFTPPAPIPGTDTKKFQDMVGRFREMLRTFTLNPYSRQEWSKYDATRNLIPTVETFVNGWFSNPFKSEYVTPYGVKEDLVSGSGDPRYVEPVGQTGLGSQARPLEAPFGLRGDKGDKGDRGERGEKGEQGARGDKGDKGDRGDKGARGANGISPPDPRLPTPDRPCGMLGVRQVRNGTMLRIYTKRECDLLKGRFFPDGQCLKPQGGSFTWDCRNVDF